MSALREHTQEQEYREGEPGAGPRHPWGALDMLWALLFGLGLGFAVLFAIVLAARASGGAEAVVGNPGSPGVQIVLIGGALYGALALGVWLFIRRRRGVAWSELGFRPVGPGALLAMVPLVPVILIADALVAALIARFTGAYENPQVASLAPDGVLSFRDFAGIFVAAAVIAPVVEELLFRGVLYPYLRARTGVPAAVVGSAALFAVVHGYVILMPVLFVTGVALALVRERYESILPAIALHAMNNAVATVGIYAALGEGA